MSVNWTRWLGACLAMGLIVSASLAWGQTRPDPRKPPAKKNEIAQREEVSLTTKDYVQLRCIYYAGKPSKKTVPIILLHSSMGPRGTGAAKDCERLALRLQQAGHTVVAPDLRGYGQSVTRRPPGSEPISIDPKRMNRRDVNDSNWDVEAVKRFLLDKNNQGELNIELLCVVGFEMGAVVGLNWVSYDWSVPLLPTYKQGQDVKAFVLVSPVMSYRGVSLNPALANPVVKGELAAMIVLGAKNRTAADGRRIYNSLERAHSRFHRAGPRTEVRLEQLDTSLDGTKIVNSPALPVVSRIVDFVEDNLVSRAADFPWQDRTRP